jgi:hypothetical protein
MVGSTFAVMGYTVLLLTMPLADIPRSEQLAGLGNPRQRK